MGVLDKHESLPYYRPMTHMVYNFIYAAFKGNYWQYHLLNLFLFAFASSLVFKLIDKLTGNHNLALLAGLFYLIHPINGILVNYISACVFSFQVIFMLGTILLLLGSLERKNDRTLYFLSLLFSFLSLFWHESALMTPLYAAVVILLFRDDPKESKLRYLFPYFLIVFSYIIFRPLFLTSNDNVFMQLALLHMTGWEYPAVMFKVLAWYIGKLFYPQGIVMGWGTPILQGHVILNVLGLFSLFMVFLLFYIRFAKEKILQMAVIWTLIGFIPVFLAAVVRSYTCAVIEPHWFIFSSIGFFILAAYFCLFILDRSKKTGIILLFIVVFSWGSVSFAYNQLWGDQRTYARYWLLQAPFLKTTYTYLAYAEEIQGDLKESRKNFMMSLSGHTYDEVIYDNLGYIDVAEGNFKDAELDCRMALKINPYSADAYHNLGSMYYAEGLFYRARENFELSLIFNPFLLDSRKGLEDIRHINVQNSPYTR